MNYDIKTIAKVINGKILSSQLDEYCKIKRVLIDSRKIEVAFETIFFALKTTKNDGHKYIKELFDKGVRNFVVSDNSAIENIDRAANILLVDNTIESLQKLSEYHRKQFDIPVIGITGSNGKTIIKEWLAFLLSKHKNVIRSPKSYNSQIGVPLSVILIGEEHEIAVIEAGISKVGEMIKIEPIIMPDIGVFSNIGAAHNENFVSLSEKILEKLKLFKNSKRIIVSSKYKEIINTLNSSDEFANDPKNILFTWGQKNSDDLKIVNTKNENGSTLMTLKNQNDDIYKINIPYIDAASVENALHCFAVMYLLNLTDNNTLKLFNELPAVSMRLEQSEGMNSCTIINDAYNSDINSLSIALDFLSQQKQNPKKTIILSDILQTGLKSKELYSEVNKLFKERQINRLIGIGEDISKSQECFESVKEKDFFLSTDEFLKTDIRTLFSNETILIKGARVFEFENIFKKIEYSSHQTVLEINLNSLVNNLNAYRSIINQETKIMVMVKAFSYGSGSFEIANVLQYHNIDYLGVAYADEGVELRENGINLPIMVIAPEKASMEKLIKYKLEPEIYNMQSLYDIIGVVNKSKHSNPAPGGIKIHIEVDTGMHRLGFDEENINELISTLKNQPDMNVAGIFSHLSAADNEEEDFTNFQIQKFNKLYEKIADSLSYRPLKHILNSAGTLRFPDAQFDMVRLGIGLYGINTTNNKLLNLENVISLKTKILQIKNVRAGDRIGYGANTIVNRYSKVAVIPIGYADGFRRNLSHGKGKVFINNTACLVIGSVCMDLTMIDITSIDAKEGDTVVIFDENHTVNQFAKQMDIIPYEVLTGISRRVKRKYTFE